MKQENLEQKVKYSRIKLGIEIAVLTASVLGGAYVIFRNPAPVTVESSAAAEPDPKDDPIENKNPVINDNPKPVETEYVSRYNYKINGRILEVYKKGNEDTDTPELKLKMPHEYLGIARKTECIEAVLKNPKYRKRNIRVFYNAFALLKEKFKPISPEDKALQQLDPKERKFAAEAINSHVYFKLDKLIEEGKPEESFKEDFYEEDVF